jgi:uncharacterized membrane protein
MTTNPNADPDLVKPAGGYSFRRAVLRGLGVLLPPLLTLVIFIWIGTTIVQQVLDPVTAGTQKLLVWAISDIRFDDDLPPADRDLLNPVIDAVEYQRLGVHDRSYVPKSVYDVVQRRYGEDLTQKSAAFVYQQYVRIAYLKPYLVVPFLLALLTLLLYLLGRFMAAGIGRVFWSPVEGVIVRLPLVRTVYSAVKQVSGFVLNERDVRYSRVVAVEYPRKGIWSLGMVTGKGIPDIEDAAGEDCLSVLIPTSPMPMAGFTINVRRSEAIDLNITMDEAIQFIVSCGVVGPKPHRPRIAPLATPDAGLLAGGPTEETEDAAEPGKEGAGKK